MKLKTFFLAVTGAQVTPELFKWPTNDMKSEPLPPLPKDDIVVPDVWPEGQNYVDGIGHPEPIKPIRGRVNPMDTIAAAHRMIRAAKLSPEKSAGLRMAEKFVKEYLQYESTK